MWPNNYSKLTANPTPLYNMLYLLFNNKFSSDFVDDSFEKNNKNC